MTRYWYHPESDSLFTTADDEPEIARFDPMTEELTEADYRRIQWRQEDALWSELATDPLLGFGDLL